jgi:hypothetical protein
VRPERPAPAASGVDPEAAYYQTIEEFFVSRRGDPLMLSNADWLLARRWRTGGIPLRVVLRGISDALDAHAHSWGRARKVGSLAYCAAEVEAARDRWERALSFGAAETPDVRMLLGRLADTIEAAPRTGASARALASAIAVELRDRSAGAAGLRALDAWLGASEAALVAAVREDAGVAAVAAIESEVDGILQPYRSRMPPRVLQQVRDESITRKLLESQGLPRLSLFHLSSEVAETSFGSGSPAATEPDDLA